MWKNVIMVDEKWVYSHDSETKSLLTMGLKNISQNWNMKASSVKGEGEVDCVFFCLFMEVMYTMNFHHVAIMSTNSTILKWWNACKRQWKEKGQIRGEKKMDAPT